MLVPSSKRWRCGALQNGLVLWPRDFFSSANMVVDLTGEEAAVTADDPKVLVACDDEQIVTMDVDDDAADILDCEASSTMTARKLPRSLSTTTRARATATTATPTQTATAANHSDSATDWQGHRRRRHQHQHRHRQQHLDLHVMHHCRLVSSRF
jgi:hypothetical protein